MARDILVVEDDRNISNLIEMYLVKEGFDVRIAGDGAKAIEEFEKKVPALILLDLMLPVMDGWAVCARIRQTSRVPIIMLTARSEVFDRIHGLEMGADDYVVKPFEMKELIARINAVLRRTEIPVDTSKKLVFDKLEIDLDAFTLIVDGVKVDTPPKELELLYHLASSPNKVYTRNQLLDEVWGFDFFGDSRTVDVHIKRLREKIENVSDQWELRTVWGVGYKFALLDGTEPQKEKSRSRRREKTEKKAAGQKSADTEKAAGQKSSDTEKPNRNEAGPDAAPKQAASAAASAAGEDGA